MATTDSVPKTAPSLDLDPFSSEVLTEPLEFYRALREAAAVVWLPRYGSFALGRHGDVRRVLQDVRTFISSAGVGLTNLRSEPGIRSPSLILEADPPAHARPRSVLNRVLSAEAVEALRDGFRAHAERLVTSLLERRSFDGMADCARAFALQVFPDAVGLAPEGRENLIAYADMLFNANGPRNDLFARSAHEAEPLTRWIMERCERSALHPGGLGDRIHQASDQGEIEATEATLLVRSLLSAGVDTTIAALGNALGCLATHPDAWQRLHANPQLTRQLFDEVLRYDSPSTFTFRTTSTPAEIAGIAIPENHKLLVSFAAANRDPRRWPEPDRFDIDRRPTGHLAFGSGIHACVGQVIARAEAETLLEVLARRVERLELAGTPRRWLNNSVRTWGTLPLSVQAP
jgi:4-methoxybenzoate monooxygenase (O-demethylating)